MDADERKRQFAHAVNEMDFAVDKLFEGFARAEQISKSDHGAKGECYRAAMTDARKLARPLLEAQRRYRALLGEEEVNEEERQALQALPRD